MGMVKGFVRIFEALLVISLLLSFIAVFTQTISTRSGAQSKTGTINRMAEDLKNMACNSQRHEALIFSSRNMHPINKSLKYALPADTKFRLAVLKNGTVDKTVGYSLPVLSGPKAETDVAASSCVLGNKTGSFRKVVVQVWR